MSQEVNETNTQPKLRSLILSSLYSPCDELVTCTSFILHSRTTALFRSPKDVALPLLLQLLLSSGLDLSKLKYIFLLS